VSTRLAKLGGQRSNASHQPSASLALDVGGAACGRELPEIEALRGSLLKTPIAEGPVYLTYPNPSRRLGWSFRDFVELQAGVSRLYGPGEAVGDAVAEGDGHGEDVAEGVGDAVRPVVAGPVEGSFWASHLPAGRRPTKLSSSTAYLGARSPRSGAWERSSQNLWGSV
jgi:hypothetical protein